MLTRLRIKNFKSFKNDTVVDLKSTNYKILSQSNIYDDVLKGGIFVGANASGKTNVIKVIKKLLDLLFAEKIMNIRDDHCLFSKEDNMILDYSFKIGKANINYYIEYDISKDILIEKLNLDGDLILNRIGSSGESKITENNIFNELDNNSLLLREIYFNTKFRGNEVLKEWFDFLANSVYIDAYKGEVHSNGNFSFDLIEYLNKNGVGEINSFFEELNFNQIIEYAKESKGNSISFKSNQEKNIFFKRTGIGEPIPFQLESLGNQNLLQLLPEIFHVINNKGMLIIDEFSSCFHNNLEELLVKYFMKKSNNAQMFIVSHSTNLLTNTLLRPDQIFITEFLGKEGSRISRASEEKPREAQNIEKMYLSGVFGGIPLYKEEKYEDK